MKKPTQINSLKELQVLMPRLLKQTSDQKSLLLAAAANPLLALAQLGYEVSSEAAQEIEHRARFGEDGGAAYEKLQAELFKTAGSEFDPADGASLQRVLGELFADDTGKGRKKRKAELSLSNKRKEALLEAAGTRPVGVPGRLPVHDPLADFAEVHPIIPLLVKWRQMELQSPRFASKEVYDRILSGDLQLPITDVTFTLQDRTRRKASN